MAEVNESGMGNRVASEKRKKVTAADFREVYPQVEIGWVVTPLEDLDQGYGFG
jgi:hypothetical protein